MSEPDIQVKPGQSWVSLDFINESLNFRMKLSEKGHLLNPNLNLN